jgi:hypothetical protein
LLREAKYKRKIRRAHIGLDRRFAVLRRAISACVHAQWDLPCSYFTLQSNKGTTGVLMSRRSGLLAAVLLRVAGSAWAGGPFGTPVMVQILPHGFAIGLSKRF